MLTKGAIGNLVNRYKAVLRKCNLINTFGSLAVASMLVLGGAGVAWAEEVITSKYTVYADRWGGPAEDVAKNLGGEGKSVNVSVNDSSVGMHIYAYQENDVNRKAVLTISGDKFTFANSDKEAWGIFIGGSVDTITNGHSGHLVVNTETTEMSGGYTLAVCSRGYAEINSKNVIK